MEQEATGQASLGSERERIEEMFFNKLKDEIKSALNFDSHQYSDNFLKRRLTVRMNANGMKSFQEYYKVFIDNPNEHESLLKNLTIHVTEFFRDKDLWDFCKKDFFPHILDIFGAKDSIRIWSAGCSSGQEAISILITFLETNPNLRKIRIICTDISDNILQKAKESVYEEAEMKNVPPEMMLKYFDKEGDNYRLRNSYRSFFEYSTHDVLQDEPLKNIDVLFFRNTVIYFSHGSKEGLYKKFHQSLNNPSFIILGKTETLPGNSRSYFDVYNTYERIFSKK